MELKIDARDLTRASSGTIEKKFAGGSYGGYYIGIDWRVNSQSASSNSSNVTATTYIRSEGNGYSISSSATKTVSITIEGQKDIGTCTVGLGTNSRKNLISKTMNVGHDGNGNKTCSFACALDIEVTLSGTWYGKVTHSGSGTFNQINLNSAPVLGGSVNVNPGGTIPENQNEVTVSWNAASDAQGNLAGYRVYRYVNGGHNATFWPGGNSFVDNISGFGQGTQFSYKVWAYDHPGLYSGEINSGTVTKNRFQGAWFTGHSNDVAWDTAQFTLNIGGASNTNGNSSFKYLFYSDDVTIYNQREITSTSETIKIWKSGQAIPDTPYIKFDDLKNKFRGSNFNSRLHVGVRTTNAYGSQAWSGGSIGVDLRTVPNPPTRVEITGGTALKTIGTTGNKYYIPSEIDTIVFEWDGGSDKIGESHQYRLYQILDKVVTEIAVVPGTTKSYSIKLPKQSSIRKLAFGVHTLTSYGYTNFKDSPEVTLHYYNPPNVDTVKVDRTDTTATATIKLNANTSIPNVNFPTRSYTGASSGTLQNTRENQTITASNLLGSNKYSWTITIKDDTGLYTSNVVATIEIPAYTPLFSVREKGVGINVIPDGSAGLMVKKGASIDGELTLDGQNVRTGRKLLAQQFTVNGDANKYYPVLINNSNDITFASTRFSIGRNYNWKAPDTWNNATHRGGLTLAFVWTGDSSWGGNQRAWWVEDFSETYSTMVGGMMLSTNGMVVWLRGGGALYELSNEYGRIFKPTVYYDTYTDSAKNTYPVRDNINNVHNEVKQFFPIRDRGRQLYIGNDLTLSNWSDTMSGVKTTREILFTTGKLKNVIGANVYFDGLNDVHIDRTTGAGQIVLDTANYPRYRWSHTNDAQFGIAQWSPYYELLTSFEGHQVMMQRGTVTDGADWNAFENVGIYQVVTPNYSSNNPPSSYYYGILLVFRSQGTVGQIYMPHSGSHFMQYRVRWASGNWTNWANVGWSQYSLTAAQSDTVLNSNSPMLRMMKFDDVVSSSDFYEAVKKISTTTGNNNEIGLLKESILGLDEKVKKYLVNKTEEQTVKYKVENEDGEETTEETVIPAVEEVKPGVEGTLAIIALQEEIKMRDIQYKILQDQIKERETEYELLLDEIEEKNTQYEELQLEHEDLKERLRLIEEKLGI